MRNEEDQPKEEKKVDDADQSQMHHSSEGHLPHKEKDDSEYTAEEIPFADGEGTKLDEWIDDEEEN